MNPADEAKPRGLTGRHVLWILLAAFATVSAVNGLFIYKAIATYSGEVAVEPYRKGLHYNQRVDADERQSRLGWTGAIEMQGTEGPLAVTLSKTGGEPVTGLVVTGQLARATTRNDDIPFKATETSPGVYRADVQAAPGMWIAVIAATEKDGGAPVFQARKRLCLGGELAVRDGLFLCQKK